MSTVRIMFAPREVSREIYFTQDKIDLVRQHLDRYLVLPPMQTDQEGFDAAAEMFDLTNNPFRQDERMAKYGNGRSLSVGDIVDVDGTKFMCNSYGWVKV